MARWSFPKLAFCQFQCNGALAAAKRRKRNPLDIAQQVEARVGENDIFIVAILKPGFINITLTDDFLAHYCSQMLKLDQPGFEQTTDPLTIVIDCRGLQTLPNPCMWALYPIPGAAVTY